MRRKYNDDDEMEEKLRLASRKLLFGDRKIPGEGRSAAETPDRHVRQKVTINLDSDIISFFKARAVEEKTPYQFLINQVLRDYVHGSKPEQLARDVAEILLGDASFLEKIKSSIKGD